MTNLIQIEEAQWSEIAAPEYIAILPLLPSDFLESHGIKFFEFYEEGIGQCYGAFIKVLDILYFLNSHVLEGGKQDNVSIQIRSYEPDSNVALENLINELHLSREDLIWEADTLGPCKWSLVRLDDNNNEVEVRSFLNEQSANWVREKYEGKSHKQLYSVLKKQKV